MDPIIVVHGGAGQWKAKQDLIEQVLADCHAAAKAGQDLLLSGAHALDAVEVAVRVLEDSPFLDAGRGSYRNQAGQIEMDALIMDGATLQLGAIAAVQMVLHPISLARRLMADGRHNLLVGSGAEAFADEIGFPRCRFEELLPPAAAADAASEADIGSDARPAPALEPMCEGDTVGAVALDSMGNVASATSTGGTRDKHAGRVGDSPLVGSGGYADNWSAAVSATGQGEALMRIVISKTVCDLVAGGLSAQGACDSAIRLLSERTQGQGGLISVDVRGRIGIAFNTGGMPHAYAIGGGSIVTGR
jgi:beta-aspartyl-peptidase (threonine type)